MFEDVLADLEARLDLPYPERAMVVAEIGGELAAAFEAHSNRGLAAPLARGAALEELQLDDAAISSLEALHLPAVRRALARLPAPLRGWVDSVAAAVPLALFLVFVVSEVPMMLFLREGGLAIWLILALGGLALLLELQRAVAWFVLRDHSPASLRRDTPTPLYLAAAMLCIGLQGAALGYYLVLKLWAEGRLSEDQLRSALREPLPNIVVAGAIATLVILLHGAVKAGLRAIRVPPSQAR